MKKTVAVDLDGVLAYYVEWKGLDHFGEPIAGAREFLQHLLDAGFEVLVFTTRVSEEISHHESCGLLANRVRAWLDQHEMPYTAIWTGQGKPLYAAIVDDRAVSLRPQDWTNPQSAFHQALIEVRRLAE